MHPPSVHFTCPACSSVFDALSEEFFKHVRIVHGKDLRQQLSSAIDQSDLVEVYTVASRLPTLAVSGKRRALGTWGKCDRCGERTTRRWLYETSSRGPVILCWKCCGNLAAKKSRVDALDSPKRLPGSYGASKR
jgi:hypothetical protein